jgi:NADH:ubiquinone reductase (H+-translocating)
MSDLPHIVILGGGFGGIWAAKSLAKARARVTLVDKSNHHLFQPLLYQVATASLSPANIAYPIRSILRRQKNVTVLMAEVTGIDPVEKKIFLSDGELKFDSLIIATGARHSYFGHPEWETLAPGLKTIPDAIQIRQKVLLAFEHAERETDEAKRTKALTFVLVGGGPTGVEMAGAIAELAHRALARDFRHIDPHSSKIILVEAGERILASFPRDLSNRAHKALEKLGVEILSSARVDRVDQEGVLIGQKRIYSSTVIWTAGVAASPVGKWLSSPTDRAGRVIVEKDLSVPKFPDIFVIGDAAAVLDDEGKTLPGLAPVAMQEGRFVGMILRNRLEGKQSSAKFRYFDKGNLATVGRSFAIADLNKIHLYGWPGWLAWVLVHIYFLIGFRNRLFVLLEWAWAYLTFQRGARLITKA